MFGEFVQGSRLAFDEQLGQSTRVDVIATGTLQERWRCYWTDLMFADGAAESRVTVRRRSGGATDGRNYVWLFGVTLELQMSWLSTRHLKRSLAVNGEMLKFFRSRRGWTQEELASVAGYTGRVIRKAEASGSLHPDTIEILAEALSGADWTVDPEDLVTTPELMARAVINAYRHKERQVVANVNGLLHDDLTVYAAGEEVGLPFAGSYAGVDGFDKFFGNYFEAFVRPDKLLFQPTFYAQGNEVILHGKEAVQAIDSRDVISSWIFIKFTFERGRLIRYENFYDTGKAAQYLKTLGDPGKRLA